MGIVSPGQFYCKTTDDPSLGSERVQEGIDTHAHPQDLRQEQLVGFTRVDPCPFSDFVSVGLA